MRFERRLIVVLLAAGLGAGACESSDNVQLLDDPHEIVTAAVTSTAALGSLHVRVDLTAQARDDQAGLERARFLVEADIDVQGRNVAGRSQMTQGDAAVRAPETSDFVYVDRVMFTRNSLAPRWFANDNPANGEHLPTTAAFLGLIERAIGNRSAVLTLGDAVSCGESTCYRVRGALDPEATWLLLVAPLVGQPADPAERPPPDMVPTPGTVELFVDQKTRLLAGINGTFSIQGTAAAFAITFSNHDLPVQIVGPPPQLIENPNLGGNGISPAPTAVTLESP